MNTSSTQPTDVAIDVLQRLLVVCADGAAGYRHAAAGIPDRSIHAMLARNAAQREEVESVLTYALVELGFKPSHHGSVAGAVHRRWLDTLPAVKADATRAILHECQRGERETIEAFSAALGRSLPTSVHNVVQSQLGRVLEASAALGREVLALDEGDGAAQKSKS